MAPRRTGAVIIVALAIAIPVLGLLVTQANGESPQQRVILTPDLVRWAPVASLRPGALSAVMFGSPDKPGPYVYRVKFPPHFQVEAHSHPDNRTYTVLSGTFYQGVGEKFDEAKLMARPAGSFYTHPAGTPHFGATRDEEVVLQIASCEGSTALKYVDPTDDPRTNKK